jgi:integrase
MRVSDCALIKWKDIDLEHKIISLIPIKVRRYNRRIFVPVHPKLFNLLKRLSKGVKDREEYVSSWNAHSYSNNYLGNVLKGVFTDCGINDGKNHLGFHTLRHTFVSVAANNNVPLPIVQSIVGHSCKSMTERYYHPDHTYALQALSKISW